MTLNGFHGSNGEHDAEMIAYMYGELDAQARVAFEDHLVTCDECVFELAAMADARLGVVEWRREDFDPLPTPEIVIDTAPAISVQWTSPKPGIFVGLVKSLTALPMISKLGTAFAAAAVVIGVAYFAITFVRPVTDIASNKQGTSVEPSPTGEEREKTELSVSSPDPGTFPDDERKPVTAANKRPNRHSEARPQVSTLRKSERTSPRPRLPSRNPQTATTQAPRLNAFDEDEDKSLRLTDLLAEIGSSDE